MLKNWKDIVIVVLLLIIIYGIYNSIQHNLKSCKNGGDLDNYIDSNL